MDSRTWDRLVAEGRSVVAKESEVKWRLGDLGMAVEDGGGDLARYAEEVGKPLHNLAHYVEVARAWPAKDRFAGVIWSVHDELRRDPNRVAVLRRLVEAGGKVTVDRARVARGMAPTRYAPPTKADRVAQAREALADPEVAAAVLEHEPAAETVRTAMAAKAANDWRVRAPQRDRAESTLADVRRAATRLGLLDVDGQIRRIAALLRRGTESGALPAEWWENVRQATEELVREVEVGCAHVGLADELANLQERGA